MDTVNHTGEGYLSPYVFAEKLSDLCDQRRCGDSVQQRKRVYSGDADLPQKRGQIVFNKGLASMGYGSGGAIGAAVAAGGRRTVLIEGDGGFMQNLQELGTVRAQKLNLKIFLFDDNGYASIRMTQSNYFGGRYVGCDIETGLGIPNWEPLFAAYDIPSDAHRAGIRERPGVSAALQRGGRASLSGEDRSDADLLPEDLQPGDGIGRDGVEPAAPHDSRPG